MRLSGKFSREQEASLELLWVFGFNIARREIPSTKTSKVSGNGNGGGANLSGSNISLVCCNIFNLDQGTPFFFQDHKAVGFRETLANWRELDSGAGTAVPKIGNLLSQIGEPGSCSVVNGYN
jgi:hypothetical protein